ncbi:MAG TPA: tetratricopeptide repeat protein [Gemmatimonadales bacterium]|nr:tetratricopeptide repeat protein [Gemmatimonadales bacterium]
MNFDKLKESARKYEQSGDWRRAIEVYQKAIHEFEAGNDPAADLSIYNRVGDLYLKANDPGGAVQAYEKAADLYREQGFYNNAIALCGKILRVNPGRSRTYLTLAYLHAHKNVVIEAKKNLLEYLDRMNATNQLDEAFKVMKEFADHFPGNKDIRLMLSDLLRASSRDAEAKEQLEKLASDLEARGDSVGARRTLQKLHAMEMGDAPAAAKGPQKGDLIFLDTGVNPPAPKGAPPRRRTTVKLASPPPAGTPEPLEIETASLTGEPVSLDSVQPISDEAALEATSLDVGRALGFEPTVSDEVGAADVGLVEGLEVGGMAGAEEATERVEGLEVGLSGSDVELGIEHSPSQVAGGGLLDILPTSLEGSDSEPVEPLEVTEDLSDALNADLADIDSAPAVSADTDLGLELIDSELSGGAEELALVDVPAPMLEEVAGGEELMDGELGAETISTAPSLTDLEALVFDDPDNPDHHRALGEALLAAGEAERGLEELDLALSSFELQEDWERANDMVDELIRLEPSAVRHYQKRVELAFRTGDRSRLITAYLELGDALMRAGAVDKALAVYSRVADHDPDNQRAKAALETLAPIEEPEAPAPPPAAAPPAAPAPRVSAPAPVVQAPPPAAPKSVPPPAVPPAVRTSGAEVAAAPVEEPALPRRSVTKAQEAEASSDFVDLGALILDDDRPRDLRMKVESEQKTGDEQKDFKDMLQAFKRGIDENIDAEDFQAHYDMGVAFKEMGLLDEAIAEFQKALRSPEGRLRTSEALGTAFYDKGQFAIAEAILKRAVETLGASDDEQIGLIYWLARSTEAQNKAAAAITWYERVMAVDIGFMDASSRMQQLSGRAS